MSEVPVVIVCALFAPVLAGKWGLGGGHIQFETVHMLPETCLPSASSKKCDCRKCVEEPLSFVFFISLLSSASIHGTSICAKASQPCWKP